MHRPPETTTTTASTSGLLSDMVLGGLGHARLLFEKRSAPTPASQILARGRRHFGPTAPAEAVAALLTNDVGSVEVLLGAIEAGVRLVSLPLPARGAGPEGYLAFLKDACRSQGASTILVRPDLVELIATSGVEAVPHSVAGGPPRAAPSGRGFELVQFSSGTTDRPKAVRLDDQALGANVAAIVAAIEPRPGDHAVSWLPLSHDMGLIGMLLTSLASADPELVGDCHIVLLDPTDFLRSPSVWLRALSECGGSVTAAPDFGYRLCVERGDAGGADLSRLRCAIVGGETIRARTLERFQSTFADAGLAGAALCPAYGLAEIGLAATITPPTSPWRDIEAATEPLGRRLLVPPDGTGSETTRMVSSGRALPGYEIRCDAAGGELGAIEIRGPSAGVDGLTGEGFADEDGWVATGDLGATVEDWLYVTGRFDDHIVAAGRNLYVPALEDAIARVEGIRAGRAAVVGTPSGEWLVVAETEASDTVPADERRRLVQNVMRATVTVSASRPDEVVLVVRGALPVTPSGKLQRREILRRHLTGELLPG